MDGAYTQFLVEIAQVRFNYTKYRMRIKKRDQFMRLLIEA